jgi:hypothetical protein
LDCAAALCHKDPLIAIKGCHQKPRQDRSSAKQFVPDAPRAARAPNTFVNVWQRRPAKRCDTINDEPKQLTEMPETSRG